MKKASYFPLQDNPIVTRAFQVGFRPGPHSFRMGLWVFILALILLIVGVTVVAQDYDYDRGAQLLLLLLVLYTAASFLFGGLQRMLISFSSERERGTFDFIHLSTMKPPSVIWGFLMAGQLPGYLLLGFTLPVMVICSYRIGASIPHLFVFLLLLAGYVILLSLLFLSVGFWTKKIADVRSGYIVLALFALGGISTMAARAPSTWGPREALGIVGGYPVLRGIWDRMTQGEEALVLDTVFWGARMPLPLLAPLFLIPVGIVLFRSLAHCLRYRERKPISDRSVLFLTLWVHFFLIGLYYGSAVETGRRLLVFSVLSYFLLQFFFSLVARSSGVVVRMLYNSGGRLLPLLRSPQGPAYLLLGVLTLEWVIALPLVGLGEGELAAARTAPVSLLGFVSLPVFLPVVVLFDQLCAWYGTGEGRKGLSKLFRGAAIFPAVLYLFLPVLERLGEFPIPFLVWVSALSPLTHVVASAGLTAYIDPLFRVPTAATLLFLAGSVGCWVGLMVLHRRALDALARRAVPAPGTALPEVTAAGPPVDQADDGSATDRRREAP